MKIPPGFLDELSARLPVSEVVGRHVKLIRRGREFVACCPFHNEKTPSFSVSDDKGFFHCFGCGAHGDAVGFVMRHQGVSFPEAVEHCAGLAGMEVPRETKAERDQRERRTSLSDVMDAAASYFQNALQTPKGASALAYASDRGLDEKLIADWRLGYAPNDPEGLREALKKVGGEEDALIELGLMRRPDDGRAPYCFFRDRLMFPVSDRRGRIVGFGGRLLSGDGPKYVNSPQSPLFDKGRLLFGHSRARDAVARGHSVIIVEGYMDVLALARAGFLASVAPLGTALTEDQLTEAWRMGPSPVLCFDGDNAGMRAAWRAAERALPLLKPDHTVRFAFLPQGEDPDSLIKQGGAGDMRQILTNALPIDAFIWQQEAANRRLDDPSARAGLEAAMNEHAGRIGDGTVASHFRRQWRDRVQETFFTRQAGGPGMRAGAPYARKPTARPPSRRPQTAPERILLSLITHHPKLYEQFGDQLAEMAFADPADARLRDCIAEHLSSHSGVDFHELVTHVGRLGHTEPLARLRAPGLLAVAPFVDAATEDEAASAAWEEYWSQIERRNLVAEVRNRARSLFEDADNNSVSRHRALRRAAGFDDFDA
ncbi:MAG: DNA primase [Pseudomonadota bacterium]